MGPGQDKEQRQAAPTDLITLPRRNLTLEWGSFIFMFWLKWLSLGGVPVPLWVVYVCFQVVVDMV